MIDLGVSVTGVSAMQHARSERAVATVDFSSLRICVTMSVREYEYECVPCVRDRVNKIETQCDSRHARTHARHAPLTHARTLMVTQIRSELKSTVVLPILLMQFSGPAALSFSTDRSYKLLS